MLKPDFKTFQDQKSIWVPGTHCRRKKSVCGAMVADLPIAGLCDDLLCHHPGSGWYGSLDGAASIEKGMVERRTFHLISWVVGIFQPCYTPVISICVYSNVPCFSDISHSNCWTSGFRATTNPPTKVAIFSDNGGPKDAWMDGWNRGVRS